MFKKISLGTMVFSLIILGTPALTSAQESESETVVPIVTSVESQPTSDDLNTDEMTPEQRIQKRETRIKEAKEKLATKLTALEEKKIANVCKSAQTKVEKVQANISNIVENRQEKYSKVSTKLADVTAKLKAAGADTAELETAIAGMEIKITEVNTELGTYSTSLTDLATMNCESDPSGFKAALEQARINRSESVLLTGSVREYVNETIKPILQSLRSSLSITTTAEGETN